MTSIKPSSSPESFLETIVKIPSISGDERILANEIELFLTSHGFGVKRQGNNLWFTFGEPTGSKHLLMNSHMDTVPANAGWKSDPFAPSWVNNRLVGLGANDAKGCVASIIFAALELHQMNYKGSQVTVALTCEEETGGQGLGTILESMSTITAAVVGEPTGLRVISSQRGLLMLKATARGISGHVANAQMLGTENAITKAARDIQKLDQLLLPAHETLGPMKAHVTQINGGLKRNQIPDQCEFFVDIRTNPGVDHDQLAQEIASHLESEVVVHSKRYLPKWTDPTHPVVVAALKAAKKDAATSSATTSDWAFLKDIPAVKVGPGDTFRSHRPDEYLLRDELIAGINFYRDMVVNFHKGEES